MTNVQALAIIHFTKQFTDRVIEPCAEIYFKDGCG